MSDTDGADSGSDFDTRFGNWNAQPGSYTDLPGQDGNNHADLINWAKNLQPDDLANLMQDPQGHAQNLAARGIEPPSDAAMQSMHQLNDQYFGTPSASNRFDVVANNNNPLDGGAPIRTDQSGKIIGNTSDYSGGGKRSVQMYQDIPPQPGEEGSNPLVEKAKKNWESSGQAKPYAPGQDPGRPPITRTDQATRPDASDVQTAKDVMPAGPASSIRQIWNKGFGTGLPTQPSPAGTGTAAPPPAVAPPPAAAAPPAYNQTKPVAGPAASTGGLLAGDADAIGKAAANTKEDTPTKDKVSDALTTLGKAMQGVKAPEPLKPPAGFAPAPRGPLQAGAPQLQALLGMGAANRMTLPILKLLGRA